MKHWVLGLWLVGTLAEAMTVPVLFSNRTDTVPGQSVFVVGNIPHLGNWDPTRAIKLVPRNCSGSECDWMAWIGIPPGTSFEYKFTKRNDCATCYADGSNVLWEPGPNRTGTVPPPPPPPCEGKTVFYFRGWSSVSLVYSNTLTGAWSMRAMSLFSDGVWRADGINRVGETNLVFVFTDNAGNWDNPDGVPGRNYETPLDVCVVKDGQIYNYWPPPVVSTNRVETFFISSTNVAGRTIRVYLPRGYDQNTWKRYPVLYMHDGQNLFLGMGAFGSWNADTNAANLIRFGKLRELIIVGVDNTSDRLREYTPPGCTPPLGGTALGGRYASFLIHELKPVIDAQYRTLPAPDHTGVLGSSMGGLISTWLGWAFPGVFGRVGAMSSSYWVCSPIPVPDTKRPIRIYLDSGDSGSANDGLPGTIAERDDLVRNGYTFFDDLDHTIGYGHTHNEYWWDRRLPRCLTFLFPIHDEPNVLLDALVCPPRITGYTGTNVTWTAFRGRRYTVQGITNEQFSTSATWSNIVTISSPAWLWEYPTAPVGDPFRFIRVRQHD